MTKVGPHDEPLHGWLYVGREGGAEAGALWPRLRGGRGDVVATGAAEVRGCVYVALVKLAR